MRLITKLVGRNTKCFK